MNQVELLNKKIQRELINNGHSKCDVVPSMGFRVLSEKYLCREAAEFPNQTRELSYQQLIMRKSNHKNQYQSSLKLPVIKSRQPTKNRYTMKQRAILDYYSRNRPSNSAGSDQKKLSKMAAASGNRLSNILSPQILINSQMKESQNFMTPQCFKNVLSQELSSISETKCSRMHKPPMFPRPLYKTKILKSAVEDQEQKECKQQIFPQNFRIRNLSKSRGKFSDIQDQNQNAANIIRAMNVDKNLNSKQKNLLNSRNSICQTKLSNKYKEKQNTCNFLSSQRKLNSQIINQDYVSILKNNSSQPNIKSKKQIQQFDSFISSGSSQEDQNLILTRDTRQNSSSLYRQNCHNPLESQEFKEFLRKKRRHVVKRQTNGDYRDLIKAGNKLRVLNRNLSVSFGSPQIYRRYVPQIF